MRVTRKGQVTIPVEIRRALGIHSGSEVEFEVDEQGARLLVDGDRTAREITRMRGAGNVELTTDEILALTRHAAVTPGPLLTRDPRRVATHIPGVKLIAPDAGS